MAKDIRWISFEEAEARYGGGGGGATWGDISGLLSDQIDLQAQLDGKQQQNSTLTDLAGKGFSGTGSIVLSDNTFLFDTDNISVDAGTRKLYAADGETVIADWTGPLVAVFPTSDPHVAGAGYWVGSTFTKSAG